jgi:hypothetical protein
MNKMFTNDKGLQMGWGSERICSAHLLVITLESSSISTAACFKRCTHIVNRGIFYVLHSTLSGTPQAGTICGETIETLFS